MDLAQYRELAAFAQFGSDLDAGTKAKLDRGARVVELFKQGQYSPIPVEEMAAVIWTMKNGYLDDVPVERVKEFQAKLQEYLSTRKAELMGSIRDKKALDKDIEIRRRIKSVKNTQQITRALQTVSASKMGKAQQAATAGREYSRVLNRVLVSLRERVEEDSHPLLARRAVKKELTILISTDKGLCGALNTNLFREAGHLNRETNDFIASGRKAVQYLARTKRHLVADFVLKDSPSLTETRQISRFALDKFLSGEVDKVNIVYTRFVNTLTQTPTIVTLLPISPSDLPGGAPANEKNNETASKAGSVEAGNAATDPNNRFGYIFAPGATEVLDAVLPEYVHFQVYQMILNARASEHSARMVAMKNATDNAKGLIKDLTLEYNKVRQAAITTELLEITTAQMAMA